MLTEWKLYPLYHMQAFHSQAPVREKGKSGRVHAFPRALYKLTGSLRSCEAWRFWWVRKQAKVGAVKLRGDWGGSNEKLRRLFSGAFATSPLGPVVRPTKPPRWLAFLSYCYLYSEAFCKINKKNWTLLSHRLTGLSCSKRQL